MENKKNYEVIIDNITSKYNEKPVKEAFELLVKLFSNIINNPGQPKFKNFKKSNLTLKTKILIIKESLPLIKAIGYKEENEDILSFQGNIDDLRHAIFCLNNQISVMNSHIREQEEKQREEEEMIKRKNILASQEKFKQMELEKERIRQQMEYDKQERAKWEKARDSNGRELHYGMHEVIVKPPCGPRGGG